MSENKKNIDRRHFFKLLGGSAAATTLAAVGCTGSSSKRGGVALSEIPKDQMSYRNTPTTGDRVSLLGYGCMRWPLLQQPAADGNVVDQDSVNELIDYAIEHGVNYFDTAPVYVQGWSERATGVALKRHPREKYYIATKLSNFSPQTWSREASIEMYNNSLEYLQTDYIDYMLLHAIGQGGMDMLNKRYIDNGILDFLVAERAAGRIRNLGFSYHGDIEVFDYLLSLHETIKWDFVQIQLNYLDWSYAKQINAINTNAEYLYSELQTRGIPSVIMEPLLGGRLAKLPNYLAGRLLAQEPTQSVASWAFRYAGTFEGVLTVLSGMTYKEHLQDNIRSYAPLQPLTEPEIELLYDTASKMMEYQLVPCTACQYCMPCPYGIDIPSIFTHYNRCVCEDYVPESSQDANYATARRAFLVGYDRKVPRLRQANRCIGCEQCLSHCPQGIKISQELQKIDQYAEKLRSETL